MIQKQITKIVALLFFVLLIIGCSSSKERKDKKKKNHKAYVNYLVSRNIDSIKANDLDYYDDFFAFKEEQKRQSLLQDPFLKVNKVYTYQGDTKVITFSVYSDNGKLYLAQANKTGSAFLTEPKSGIIKLKQQLELISFGSFELNDTIIKNTIYRKKPSKEWYGCDVGHVKNDTITLTAYYSTKKYGDYKKKLLAKTHKTNFKLIYQPDLKAIKTKNKLGSNTFRIEGSFNVEKNSEEEKMLQLLEKVKY